MKIKCIGYSSYYDGDNHFIPGNSYKYENGVLGPSEKGFVFTPDKFGDVLRHVGQYYKFSTQKKFNGLEEKDD